MYKSISQPLQLSLIFITISFESLAQLGHQEPWKENQLIEPLNMASIINTPSTKQPTLISIGSRAIIMEPINIDPAKRNLLIA